MTLAGFCFAALAAFAALGACSQSPPPRELRLELPALITSKEPVMVHARAIQQDGLTSELRGEQPFRVTPDDLARVSQRGMLACSRSGEGSLSLTVAGVTGRAAFACRLVARLQAPERLSIDAAAGEIEVPVKVLDAAGQELDVPLHVTTDLAGVLVARSGKLVPGNVGKAKLSVRAGPLSKQIEAEVVRTIKPELLPIDHNRRISYALERGKYRLSIELPSPGRVIVDWLGAPYCAYQGNGTRHQADCTLQRKGGVSFDNPAFLLRGDRTPSVDGVTLREVP